MTVVLYMFLSDAQESERRVEVYNELPESVLKQAQRYRSIRRKMEFLAGRSLLRTGLCRIGSSTSLETLTYTPEGKPYFPGGPQLNISHSGRLVACAVSDTGELGLDVEAHRKLNPDDFRPWFPPEVIDSIRKSGNPEEELIRRWTVTEAFFKACGVQQDIPVFPDSGSSVHLAGRDWYMYPIHFSDDFKATLVSEEACLEISPERIPDACRLT